MNDTINLDTERNTHFSFKFSDSDRELCELYEHGGFPEWKQSLLNNLLPSFDSIIDLSPTFGFFAVNISKINNNIKIGLRDDNTNNDELLKLNLDKNNVNNVFILESQVTHDKALSNNENLGDILLRSTSAVYLQYFLSEFSSESGYPALIVENQDSINNYNQLTEFGYEFFIYCPLIKKLIPLSLSNDEPTDFNVFFGFTQTQVKSLTQNSLILDTSSAFNIDTIENNYWVNTLANQRFSQQYVEEWKNNPSLNNTYINLLNIALYSLTHELSNDQKFQYLLKSYNQLESIELLDLTFAQLFTAARITYELGFTKQCQIYLLSLIEAFQTSQSLELNEPFIPTLEGYESLDSNQDIANWCLASILEAYELNRSDSCYDMQSSDYELLELFINLPYNHERLSRRYEIHKAIHDLENKTDDTSNASQAAQTTNHESLIGDPQKPDIAIIYHLARTGGTLISKCMACIDYNILLSEIHPLISVSNPIEQATEWFNLFGKEESEKFKSQLNYVDSIKLIQQRVKTLNKKLIIRDWSHIDFTAVPFVNRCSYQLTQTESLKPYFNVRQIATVRHPVDSYLSISKLQLMQEKLTLEDYLYGALEFAVKAKEMGFVRYEDFCANPKHHLQLICNTLDIHYDDVFLDRFFNYTKISGETSGGRSQGTEINVPKRREVDADLAQQILNNENYWKILEILEYENYL